MLGFLGQELLVSILTTGNQYWKSIPKTYYLKPILKNVTKNILSEINIVNYYQNFVIRNQYHKQLLKITIRNYCWFFVTKNILFVFEEYMKN